MNKKEKLKRQKEAKAEQEKQNKVISFICITTYKYLFLTGKIQRNGYWPQKSITDQPYKAMAK